MSRGLSEILARAASALAAIALAAVLAVPGPARAQAQERSLPGGFTGEQVEGLESIIRRYLLDNPEVLVESLKTYQERQKVAEEERRGQALGAHYAALTQSPDDPIIGNPNGDVTIVEFFDYRCGYCRKVVDDLRTVVQEDGNVRLVMKEFPILGPSSILAARAALAVAKQGKYEAYHFALMTQPGDMSEPHLLRVAEELEVDLAQMKQDMESSEVKEIIRRNYELAEALGINGTPGFVFGKTLVPGAIDAPTMRRLIAEARAKAS